MIHARIQEFSSVGGGGGWGGVQVHLAYKTSSGYVCLYFYFFSLQKSSGYFQ